jgi:hypothetical protein
MSNETLYKVVSVCRRLGEREAVVYRCLELLPGQGFVVQRHTQAVHDSWRVPRALGHLAHGKQTLHLLL